MKYIAKVHYQANSFAMTYVKDECELNEGGNPKQDEQFLYLKSGAIARQTIRALEIVPVSEMGDGSSSAEA